jgi:hypothetical protein
VSAPADDAVGVGGIGRVFFQVAASSESCIQSKILDVIQNYISKIPASAKCCAATRIEPEMGLFVSSGDELLYPWASAHAIDPSWEFRTCDGAAAVRAGRISYRKRT